MIEGIEALRSIQGNRLVAFRRYQYAPGLECAECVVDSGFALRFRAYELPESHLDTHCLSVKAIPRDTSEEPSGHRSTLIFNASIEGIEVFRRDEWAEQCGENHATVGINPILVRTGPVGSGPASAHVDTVICGVAVHTESPSPQSIMIYVADYPGLIGWTSATNEISEYRKHTTSEFL